MTRTRRRGKALVSATIAILMVLPALPAGPVQPAAGAVTDALVVDDDGLDCPHAGYGTIQDAVSDAEPNGTVLVCAGTYKEEVYTRTGGLTIRAADDEVVLEGARTFGSRDRAFWLDGPSITVDGFTIRNYASKGVWVTAQTATVSNNTIVAPGLDSHDLTHHETRGVHGVNRASTGSVDSMGTTIEHNTIRDVLEGVHMEGLTNLTIRHNTISTLTDFDAHPRAIVPSRGIHVVSLLDAQQWASRGESLALDESTEAGCLVRAEQAPSPDMSLPLLSEGFGDRVAEAGSGLLSPEAVGEALVSPGGGAGDRAGPLACPVVDAYERSSLSPPTTPTHNTIANNTIGRTGSQHVIGGGLHNGGMLLVGQVGGTVTGNEVTDSHGTGLIMRHSRGTTLADNRVADSHRGIELLRSTDLTLHGNELEDNGQNLLIEPNRITRTAFHRHAITPDNTVGGDPVVYLNGVQDRVVDAATGAGQVIVVNSQNVTVRDLHLSNGGPGVSLVDTDDSRIENVTVEDGFPGIRIGPSSTWNVVTNNTVAAPGIPKVWHESVVGIEVPGLSQDNRIEGNRIADVREGIRIRLGTGATGLSQDNRIASNTIVDVEVGIRTLRAAGNTLEDNTVLRANAFGILVECHPGAHSADPEADHPVCGEAMGNEIVANTVEDGLHGIGVAGPRDRIRDNLVRDLDGLGIFALSGHSTSISSNRVTATEAGIVIFPHAEQALLEGNRATGNAFGIVLRGPGHTLRDNAMSDNSYNLDATTLHEGLTIASSNTVDGRPVLYLKGVEDRVVDASTDAGWVGLVDSRDVTVRGLSLSRNAQGVFLQGTEDVTVTDVTVAESGQGVLAVRTNGTRVVDSTFTDVQDLYWNGGVWLIGSGQALVAGNEIGTGDAGLSAGILAADCCDSPSQDHAYRDNGVAGSGIGIWDAGDRATVARNAVKGGTIGLLLWGDGAEATGNELADQDLHGIFLSGNGHAVSDNVVRDSGNVGLFAFCDPDPAVDICEARTGNVLAGNEIRRSGIVGMLTFSMGGVDVRDNLVTGAHWGLVADGVTESVVIRSNTFRDNVDGVAVGFSRAPIAYAHNRIVDNADRGLWVTGAADSDRITLESNVITGNGALGVDNDDPWGTVRATRNFWGSADGPSSPGSTLLEDPETGAPADGGGDPVSAAVRDPAVASVRFDPWLEAAPKLVFDVVPQATVTEGEPLSLSVSVHDPEGGEIEIRAEDLPDGASFEDHGDGSGTLEWTPDFTQDGLHEVTFVAETANLTAARTVPITVEDVPTVPEVSVLDPVAPSNGGVVAGDEVTLEAQVSVTDGTVTAVAIHPDGSGSEALEAEPDPDDLRGDVWEAGPVAYETTGTKTIVVEATDGDGDVTTSTRTFEVVGNRAPRASIAAPDGGLTVDDADPEVRLDGSSSSDPDGHPVRSVWQITDGAWSSWRTLGASSNVPPITWEPRHAGVWNATLTLTDPQGARDSATVRVEVDDAVGVDAGPGPGSAAVGPDEQAVVEARVTDVASEPVQGASVAFAVTHVETGRETATVHATTDADGEVEVALPYDVEAAVGVNLLGDHRVDVTVEADNDLALAGDDGVGPETAEAAFGYEVRALG